jgi:peptidoglycan hydrolase-like protein with peptidoglycan-binding domain
MNRLSSYSICLCTLALLAAPAAAPAGQPSSQAQEKPKKEKDTFDKAGKATEGAMKKAGEATEKGLEAAGKGIGAAVEHTGRGVTKGAKATAGALEHTGEAVADFFDGNDADQDRVRAVQRALQEKGYYAGPIDGIAGPKTRSGVREYQQDERLAVTGKVDEKTAERLGVE